MSFDPKITDFEVPQIPKEKLQFVQREERIHDLKFDTKPVGYFLDAWYRFRKNKSSVVAAIVILILMLYAIFVPIFSSYGFLFMDPYYSYALPKCELTAKLGFWDGCKKETINQVQYDYYSGIPGAIEKVYNVREGKDKRKGKEGRTVTKYDVKRDTYDSVGYVEKVLSKKDYEALVDYCEETGVEIMVPLIDEDNILSAHLKNDANLWFVADQKGKAIRDDKGELVPNFKTDENGEYVYLENPTPDQYVVRVLYKEYFKYINGKYPSFLFGVDNYGQDIFVRLAGGARLSFLLGICVSFVNIVIGVVIGAAEGYYGGTFDLIFERIKEILGSMPFIVTATLFNLHFAQEAGPLAALFFAYILTGWIGDSHTTRTQFYRFKGQEYILSARTLGAKDRRIIFKHILPNAIGTMVTSFAFAVPAVIFTESNLSYLGIINLDSRTMTSVGNLLSVGQAVLSVYPHVILFPAIFISALEIAFSLFGNGLRDALNPSLRGAE